MRELIVVGVRADTWRSRPMVLLKERQADRYLPIPAGEGTAAEGGVPPVAPVSAALFSDVLAALGTALRQIEVTESTIVDGRCVLVFGGGVRVPAGTLEATSLAQQLHVPIQGPDAVLDRHGVIVPGGDADSAWRTIDRSRGYGGQLEVTTPLEPIVVPVPMPDETRRVVGSRFAGSPVLVMCRGPEAGTEFPLEAEVVGCGRDPGNEILLDDVTVSRKHTEFHRGRREYTVCDLGSLNGTYVNGERVRTATLTSGDEVRIGRYVLLYRHG